VNSSTTPSLWPLSGHMCIYTIGLATSVNCTYQNLWASWGLSTWIILVTLPNDRDIYGSVALSVLSCFTVQCGMF